MDDGPDLLPLLDVVTRCPGCDARGLHPADNGRVRNFFCERCGACWELRSDGPRRVEALKCPGCTYRRSCLASSLGRSQPAP